MAAPHSIAAALEKLRTEKNRFRDGLISRNTVIGYHYDVLMWEAWCAGFGLSPLPAEPETLSLYLTDLLLRGKKITTARRRKCAIVHEHRSHGFPSPNSLDVQELLRGAQRLRAEKPRQMRPVTVRELRRMSAGLAKLGTPTALRDRAILVLGFASALRRSTLAAMILADVEFVRQGLILHIGREKQDQAGKGRLVGIARGRNAETDPVRVLKAWLEVRGDAPGPLFQRLNQARRGDPLDGPCILRLVKKRLAEIGVDPIQSGAHSLRAGTVTAMGEKNVGELRIGAFTGQSAHTVARYFRRSEIWRNNASSVLGL